MEVKGREGKHLSHLMANSPQSQENRTHGFDLRIEINRLVHPEERAITNCKLEDEATQLSGQGVPITGFDDPQLS